MAEPSGFALAGKAPGVEEIHTIALHDPEGKIHHMHLHVRLKGGTPFDRKKVERDVVSLAQHLGRDVSKLKVFHTAGAVDTRRMYRVDIEKQTLVEVEKPERTTKKAR